MVSSSHDPEDSFISDEEEELCPLCVEEMDIFDKNFKPCPCGYQVCQFCYNNIRQNPQLNGRCPGCRRPYDDESVEYREISTEEWKHDHAKQARRERDRKQRERERKETEQTSKKHLSGMRVIQKNLVYVIGLNPNIPTEELHNTLRGDQFFGQYGKIQKIVINRRNNASGNPGIGVYVTFARKEDAAKCIAAVDGSVNDNKYLRAAYGTTKYCSSYLRGQTCPNPHCMFLHEPGEEADSYTRQDLSTIQHAAKQGLKPSQSSQPRTIKTESPSGNTSAPEPEAVIDTGTSTSTSSALPPTASWANKSPQTQSQKLHVSPATPSSVKPKTESAPIVYIPQAEPPVPDPSLVFLNETLDLLSSSSPHFTFSSRVLSESELNDSSLIVPLFSFSENPTNFSKSQTLTNLFTSMNFLPGSGVTSGTSKTKSAIEIEKTATPPPGLFSNSTAHQNENSHKLLDHLMNGGSRATEFEISPAAHEQLQGVYV